MLESQFEIVKQKMVSRATVYILKHSRNLQAKGTAVSCIATRELDNWMESDGSADEEELIMDITATAYAGESVFATDRRTLLNVQIRQAGPTP
jgi:hypothetical protein